MPDSRSRPQYRDVTDAQFAALLSAILGAIGALGAVIRWAVNRVAKAIDDSTAARSEQAKAEVELAKSLTAMALRLEDAIGDISIVRAWVEEHTPVGGTEQPPELRAPARPATPQTRRTPVGGVPIVERRGRTSGDADR